MVQERNVTCHACGATLHADARFFCGACGVPQRLEPTVTATRPTVVPSGHLDSMSIALAKVPPSGIALLGAVILIVGTLVPWATRGSESIVGRDLGLGMTVLLFGIALVLLILVASSNHTVLTYPRAKRWLMWGSLGLALLASLVCIYVLVRLDAVAGKDVAPDLLDSMLGASAASHHVTAKMGWGLPVAALGSTIAAIGSLLAVAAAGPAVQERGMPESS